MNWYDAAKDNVVDGMGNIVQSKFEQPPAQTWQAKITLINGQRLVIDYAIRRVKDGCFIFKKMKTTPNVSGADGGDTMIPISSILYIEVINKEEQHDSPSANW